MNNVLLIKNMNCIHCQGRIEKAMAKAGISCTVKLDDKSVTVNDSSMVEEAKKVISAAGYTIL